MSYGWEIRGRVLRVIRIDDVLRQDNMGKEVYSAVAAAGFQPTRAGAQPQSLAEPPRSSGAAASSREGLKHCNLDLGTSLLGKHTCLAVRTRRVNLQVEAEERQRQAGGRPEVTVASHRDFCFCLPRFRPFTDLRCKSLFCFGFTSPYGYTVLRHSPGRMSPRKGARRGGGREGRGAGRGQPEEQPAVSTVDPNAPVTQADLPAMEQRYQDMLQAALAPFLAAQQN
ncbi:uncharacterized protein E6C27_scaffold319G002100 [Cucumis melo var. makuwa]|uniref:Gag protease polyprotein n=1 Tax=Cucumis melo var. makuwa TaxID=1194695 RepID=A0A5A7UP21_CUCMM|nr:uncharacterized protein E6C27_scaffold319G002100 [Cucumis melo var. makuwa]